MEKGGSCILPDSRPSVVRDASKPLSCFVDGLCLHPQRNPGAEPGFFAERVLTAAPQRSARRRAQSGQALFHHIQHLNSMPSQPDQSTLKRTDFVIVPKQLLRDCRDRKNHLFVYAWLWDHAGTDDKAYPSIETQSVECGMKADDVRQAHRWLEAGGWVTSVQRPGFTTVFHVRSEPALSGKTLMNTREEPRQNSGPSPGRGTPPKGVSPRRGVPPNGGYPKRGEVPLPQPGEGTPPPNGGYKQEVLNKKKEEQPLEPPVSPTALRAPGDEPASVVEVTEVISLDPVEPTQPDAPGDPAPVAAATSPITAEPVVAAAAASKPKAQPKAAATAKSRSAQACPLPGDAPELEPDLLDLLATWWQRRCRVHPRADRLQLGTRTLNAIRLAVEHGVLEGYLEQAAEAGWQSLGHEGHRRVIAGLAEAATTSDFPLALAHTESRMLRSGKPNFDPCDLRQQKRDAMNRGINHEVRRAHDDQFR